MLPFLAAVGLWQSISVSGPSLARIRSDATANPTSYGLGTAAAEDVGTAVGDVCQLEDIGGGVAGLPAVDASQVLNVPAAAGTLLSANNLSDVANAATSADNLGLGTGDSPAFAGLSLSGGDVTAVDEVALNDAAASPSAAGRLRRNGTNVEWHDGTAARVVYRQSGTDVAISDGGTGASTAEGARANLDVEIGVDVQAYDATLAAYAGGACVADALLYCDGADSVAAATLTAFGRSLVDDANAAAAQATLGLEIGTDVQAHDADLTELAGLSDADGNFIVGSAGGWVAESGATARTSLGVGTGDSPTFTALSLNAASNQVVLDADAASTGTVTMAALGAARVWTLPDAAGTVALLDGGQTFTSATWNGAAIPVANGGTGAGNGADARVNLGVEIGVDVQAFHANLSGLAGLAGTGLVAQTGAGAFEQRTITGTADQVNVADGDGVGGNPTLSLPQSIATTSSPTFAGLTTTGGRTVNTTSIDNGDTPYTVLATDHVIFCDPSAGEVTINLPAVAAGRVLFLKKTDAGANKCVLDGSGAETIDGAATYDLDAAREPVIIVASATEWMTF